MTRHRFFIGLCIGLLVSLPASAQQPRIDPAGIDGALMLAGGYDVAPTAFEKFVELAGGAKAKLVILKVGKAPGTGEPDEGLGAAAKKLGADEPRVASYDDAANVFKEATGVWLHMDSSSTWGKALKARPITEDCRDLLKRGGVIGSAAFGAAQLASNMIVANPPAPGLALLPDSLIDPVTAKKYLTRVPKKLKQLNSIVGYEIDRDSALLVKGRTLSVVGPGAVRIFVGTRTVTIRGKEQEDLTALRRAARDHAQAFPPTAPEPPVVANGTLVIVGGGGSPKGMYQKFVEYAGGPDKANIVIFPTANPDPLPKRDSIAQTFRKAGAKKATVLYARTQTEVESKEFLDTLGEATGLWFDGGRQWRFVDCYENTKALPLMFDVLKRGGVIGGTSAGATIQGDYLCRGGVFHNFDIRYPGYERGLGFLKGVAIDQHFTQRKRQTDMTSLMKTYPQYLGIGLDEATAIVVKGQVAEVIGNGKAHFYDAQRKLEKGQPDFEALPAGARYDLRERKILSTSNATP